ncbi:MAG TPA: LysM peptidoglycan-binding domain-containing protein [Bauldia sp.]|nr:LysM peptidoglycan-binding domain-containing protein [Bauldia sp.]
MIRGRRFLAALAAAFLLPLLALAPAATAGTKPPAPVLGTVYVFRPMGGKMATPEMDNIAAKIRERGLAAGVYNYVDWIRPANEAIARYKAETWKSPIIVIGHSAGGDSAIRFSSWLNRSGVPVDLVITLDPTRIAGRVPRNVGRFINIYSSMNTLGGGDPKPASDFHGHFASVDLKNVPNLIHRYLPRTPGLQERVVEKIAAVAEDPPPAEAATVPIEYPIPAGEPIVLFDAGEKGPVKAGDTATSIAERYGVPAWAVAELNHVKPGQALIAGREVVVPRDIDSVARQAN